MSKGILAQPKRRRWKTTWRSASVAPGLHAKIPRPRGEQPIPTGIPGAKQAPQFWFASRLAWQLAWWGCLRCQAGISRVSEHGTMSSYLPGRAKHCLEHSPFSIHEGIILTASTLTGSSFLFMQTILQGVHPARIGGNKVFREFGHRQRFGLRFLNPSSLLSIHGNREAIMASRSSFHIQSQKNVYISHMPATFMVMSPSVTQRSFGEWQETSGY